MHPRNPFFNNPPDFAKLALLYPEFLKYCQYKQVKSSNDQTCTIDFKDPEALKAVCCVLLKDSFGNYYIFSLNSSNLKRQTIVIKGLKIDIPLNHLIPRIPQRLNYVLWIEDLIERPQKAIGIDIGLIKIIKINSQELDLKMFI